MRIIDVILKVCSNSGSLLGETQSKIFKDLLQNGFGVNPENVESRNLFHTAIQSGCLTIVENLLNLGTFNVESKAENNFTPLHTAVKYTRTEIARLLIKNHADVNAKDGNGKTPLHVLDTYYQCPSINRFKYNNPRDHRGYSFALATFDECKELLELLLEHKADIESVDKEKETPLYSAIRNRNEVTVKILLDKGAMVNAKQNDGLTPLHVAAKHGTRKIVNFLLDNDADINLLSNNGETPLNCASNLCFDDLGSRIFKMFALNHWVCDNNVRAMFSISPSSPLTSDRRRHSICIDEVNKMRQEKIGSSNVSYYDILTISMNRLVFYAKNKDIVRAIDKGRHKVKFPLYSSMLYHRFKNAQERAESLLDSSIESLRFLTGYRLENNTIIAVFDYLSNRDLRNLIKATKTPIGTCQTKHEYSIGTTCEIESVE